jgi:hypothetical protein
VSLLTDLHASYLDHRRCGELEAGVEGPVIWRPASAARVMARRADDGAGLDASG